MSPADPKQLAEAIAARARTSASRWSAVATLALLGFGVATAGGIIGLQVLLYGRAGVKIAVLVGLVVPTLFIGPARRFVRRREEARRRWGVARAVREHGVRAEEIERHLAR